ncbi:hypothetical protein HYFRA_00007919 [Hymenoscyphus fraxineus]|uniref:Large ribosomal subunit protein uL6 alpha-beta domain-containing protein n=1 Tax=Hymenoscyphus fraxineus TaxID=746836 RepID=A0A9N9PQ38_9HELO|nr:hypothetical protein HYFRA_00007919 [Hymenoscyphus fraxineus]
MLSTARCKAPGLVLSSSSSVPSATIPTFLLPALVSRPFSTTRQRASQIGKAPLSIPPGVKFEVFAPGMGGSSMTMTIPPFVKLEHDTASRKAYVTVEDKEVKKQREMWGTTRAYLQNHILGVSEGHTAILRLVGVGYRATVENTATTVSPAFPGQQFVVLKVGYSHPIELPVPAGVKASTPQPTRILLEGVEKEVLLQFAAKIRVWRKPEPYKGKGIFVNGETIKLKAKKIK